MFLLYLDATGSADPKDEALFQDLHAKYCRPGHELGQVENVIKKPTFVDSKKSLSIQAADLVAYAARRYIERWDKRDANGVCHEEKQFRRILPKLDRHGGHLHGARQLIDSRRCGCLICQERGYADTGQRILDDDRYGNDVAVTPGP